MSFSPPADPPSWPRPHVRTPPHPLDLPDEGRPVVFLAGSIEMGTAANWQSDVTASIADLDVVVLNPRRDEWDASWKQSADNPMFHEQVSWELEGLERASLVAMYFDPATKAPVTLLELGLFARCGRLVVCCPEGYFRKGNVDVVCARYGVPRVANLDALVAAIRGHVRAHEASNARSSAG